MSIKVTVRKNKFFFSHPSTVVAGVNLKWKMPFFGDDELLIKFLYWLRRKYQRVRVDGRASTIIINRIFFFSLPLSHFWIDKSFPYDNESLVKWLEDFFFDIFRFGNGKRRMIIKEEKIIFIDWMNKWYFMYTHTHIGDAKKEREEKKTIT